METNKIHESLQNISELITEDKEHMKEVLNMLIGGLIIPSMVEENPDLLDEDNEFKEMMIKYSRTEIEKKLKGSTEVEKVVEVEKVIEKIVEVNKKKFRRLKTYSKRDKKQKRVLTCSDRDTIIRWFNSNQRLSSPDEPIGEELAEAINTGVTDPEKLIAPYQINGYISHLCRLAIKETEENRNKRINNAIARGDMTLRPIYTDEFVKVIQENWEQARQDEEEGEKERASIRAQRAA